MITSKDNDRLRLIRRLRARKHRDRDGLFVTEGEDLLDAGLSSGADPELVLSAHGSGLGGMEVAADLLAEVSTLGSGTRVIAVWRRRLGEPRGPVCVYLHGVRDPANVGAVLRSAHALVAGSVALGPGCADPFSAKATRASMGSVFGTTIAFADVEETPEPRAALVPRGGAPLTELRAPVTVCLGAEREGLPKEVVSSCERSVTIPLRPSGAESLNVGAAAAIALQRISSAAVEEGTSDA